MRVLVVSGDTPYPPNHGGRIDILRQLETMNACGFDVDLLICSSEPISKENTDGLQTCVKNIFWEKRHTGLWTFLLSMVLFAPYQCVSRRLLSRTAIPDMEYDVLLLEAEYGGYILNNKNIKWKRVISRIQNNESKYHIEISKSSRSIASKLFYFAEALKFWRYTKKICKAADRLWFISKEELNSKFFLPFRDKSSWIPTPLTVAYKEGDAELRDRNSVLYTGNLFMPNNIEGIEWFIAHVAPVLIKKNPLVKLIFAGNAKNGLPECLLNKKLDNIEVIRSPSEDAMDSLFRSCAVFVNPILSGAGVKIKTLEALRYGIPLVTTSTGGEGIGLINKEHAMVEDDPVEFAAQVLRLMQEPVEAKQLASRGIGFVMSAFNAEKLIRSEILGA